MYLLVFFEVLSESPSAPGLWVPRQLLAGRSHTPFAGLALSKGGLTTATPTGRTLELSDDAIPQTPEYRGPKFGGWVAKKSLRHEMTDNQVSSANHAGGVCRRSSYMGFPKIEGTFKGVVT